MCQASSTYTALHNPWSHFIFGLWWVSLAEYLLVLRVLFPLLQLVQFIMTIARTASLINPSLMLLWKCDHELALYLNNVADVGLKLLICFRYYFT